MNVLGVVAIGVFLLFYIVYLVGKIFQTRDKEAIILVQLFLSGVCFWLGDLICCFKLVVL